MGIRSDDPAAGPGPWQRVDGLSAAVEATEFDRPVRVGTRRIAIDDRTLLGVRLLVENHGDEDVRLPAPADVDPEPGALIDALEEGDVRTASSVYPSFFRKRDRFADGTLRAGELIDGWIVVAVPRGTDEGAVPLRRISVTVPAAAGSADLEWEYAGEKRGGTMIYEPVGRTDPGDSLPDPIPAELSEAQLEEVARIARDARHPDQQAAIDVLVAVAKRLLSDAGDRSSADADAQSTSGGAADDGVEPEPAPEDPPDGDGSSGA